MSAMADTSAGGEDTCVRQINKSHKPTGVRACSPLQFPPGKGDGKGGWDQRFGFPRGFNAPVMGCRGTPVVFVIGSTDFSVGGEVGPRRAAVEG